MKRKLLLIFLSLVSSVIFLTGCQAPQQKVVLPLEIQTIQKRDFETTKKISFASIVSVLQDLGYIIGSADFDTGLITATSPTSETTDWILTGSSYQSFTKVTGFVEEISSEHVSIRLNFVANKTASSVYGQSRTSDTPILDKNVYIEAFNKIENAIFVRQ